MNKVSIAAVSLAALIVTSSTASAQLCVIGIFAAAAQAGARDHRELTSEEALSCGVTYLIEPAKPKAEPKKGSRRAKESKEH
jgi:hypothetical protein